MGKIGFNKNLQKSCSYCVYSKKLELTGETICKKRGVMPQREYCRKYKYDPLKRTPEKITFSGNYSAEDFKL